MDISSTPPIISIHAPSRERLMPTELLVNVEDISIHAPSRERPTIPQNCCSLPVFQSTLPHGSDQGKDGYRQDAAQFQSTLPHGSDQGVCTIRSNIGSISIHAPSRERHAIKQVVGNDKLFQSTLPHESDKTAWEDALDYIRFQSTLPHGSDKRHQACRRVQRDFNPRSLTGAT